MKRGWSVKRGGRSTKPGRVEGYSGTKIPLDQDGKPLYGPTVRKYLVDHLKIPEEEIPNPLKNTILAKSKKGPLGSLTLTKYEGMVTNKPYKAVMEMEKRIGGRDALEEGLTAVEGELSKDVKKVLELLRTNKTHSIARCIAESGAEITKVFDAFGRGMIYLNKLEAVIKAAQGAPGVIRDLLAHAIDREDICKNCVGSGYVPWNSSTGLRPKKPCKMCRGTGKLVTISNHKEFAAKTVLEAAQLLNTGKGTTVNVNQQVGIKLGQGPTFMERMVRASDKLLYGEVVDVQPEPDRQEQGES